MKNKKKIYVKKATYNKNIYEFNKHNEPIRIVDNVARTITRIEYVYNLIIHICKNPDGTKRIRIDNTNVSRIDETEIYEIASDGNFIRSVYRSNGKISYRMTTSPTGYYNYEWWSYDNQDNLIEYEYSDPDIVVDKKKFMNIPTGIIGFDEDSCFIDYMHCRYYDEIIDIYLSYSTANKFKLTSDSGGRIKLYIDSNDKHITILTIYPDGDITKNEYVKEQ